MEAREAYIFKILCSAHDDPSLYGIYVITIFTLSQSKVRYNVSLLRNIVRCLWQRHACRILLTLFPRGKPSTIILMKIGDLKSGYYPIVKQINSALTSMKRNFETSKLSLSFLPIRSSLYCNR